MFRPESAGSDSDAKRPGQGGAGEPPPGLGVRYVSHPASLPKAPCPPSPPPPTPVSAPPWSPRERFAPPGPARIEMSVLDMTLPGNPSLPAPTPPSRTMFTAAAEAPSPAPVAGIGGIAAPEAMQVAEHPPVPEPAVAWPEPGAAPEPARARRQRGSDDKLASLWAAEPVDRFELPDPAVAQPRRGRLLVVGVAGVAAVMLAGGAAAMLLSRRDTLAALPPVNSIYNAPMMVLRASLAGQVRDVAVHPGQVVGPDTPLLTVHTARAAADFAVLAHVNGVVRSIEAQVGAEVAPGAPLARVLDCDHAFLTLDAGVALRAGQSVLVRLPGLPAVERTVRDSVGSTEPVDGLVVPLPAADLGGACPVGSGAVVSPVAGG